MNHYPLIKKCVICNKNFIVRNGAEYRNTTCSKICGNKKAGRNKTGEKHWNWGNPNSIKGEKHPFYGKHHTKESNEMNRLAHLGRPAWNIGIPITEKAKTKMSSAKKGRHISIKTEFKKGLIPWNKGRKSPQFSGENNPNWKGGVTPERNKIRASVEYKIWEKTVKERDQYTCQKCGESRRGYVMAHHVLNFAQWEELRFILENGVTLCRPCHKEFHKIYGKKNNNQGQVIRFIGKHLQIDMEKMMRAINEKFGWDFVHDYAVV